MAEKKQKILWPSQLREQLHHRQSDAEYGNGRTIEFYQSLPWRETILALLSECEMTGGELMYQPSKLMSLIHADTDQNNTQEIEEILLGGNKLVLSLLLVEWRFRIFKECLIEDNWTALIRPIENYWEAKYYLKSLLQEEAQEIVFRNEFKTFCINVFAESKESPARFWPYEGREKQQLKQLIENWKSEQSLSSISWVERDLGYIMPFADDCNLFEFVIALDTKFAVDLLESFENPYQPMAILSYQLYLASDYDTWAQLFEASASTFDSKGQWNGKMTSILLYSFLEAALSRHYDHRIEERDDAAELTSGIELLCQQLTSLICKRRDSQYFSFFITSELFRTLLSILDRENQNFPTNDSRAWPIWKLIDKISNTKQATKWSDLLCIPLYRADKLCQLSVRIIAENNQELPITGMHEILDLFPTRPEDLFHKTDTDSRSEISQFMVFSKRPDAFGFRVIAMAFANTSRAANYEKIWHHSSTAREIIEFEKFSYLSNDDNHRAAMHAKDLLLLTTGIGLSLLNNCLDHRIKFEVEQRSEEAQSLFHNIFSSILEMTAIELRGLENYISMLSHFVNLRAIAWVEHPRNKEIAIKLQESDQPSVQRILNSRREVANNFFQIIASLMKNGLTYEQVCSVCTNKGAYAFDIIKIINNAKKLNGIDANRQIDLSFLP
jgi:hypothetical protein